MDWSRPIRSVIPTARADVLVVLARAGRPLSGRQVAALVDTAKQWRVNDILRELTTSGLVLCDVHPPAHLYRLNRDHVAAGPIEALANLRSELMTRMRSDVANWQPAPVAVWLFGSFARGDGGPDSDIDVLVIRRDAGDLADEGARAAVSALIERVEAWSGNGCEVLELSEAELRGLVHRSDRLVDDLRSEALHLAGVEPRRLLKPDD